MEYAVPQNDEATSSDDGEATVMNEVVEEREVSPDGYECAASGGCGSRRPACSIWNDEGG